MTALLKTSNKIVRLVFTFLLCFHLFMIVNSFSDGGSANYVVKSENSEGRRLLSDEKSKDKHDHQEKKKKESDEEEWWSDEHGILHHLRKRNKDLGFLHGFVASLSVIIVSELGDKTFFIAAIMAMRHSRLIVLLGALGALVFMTILSGLVGYATTVIPRAYTYYISSILFAVFGVKMLKEGWNMSADEGQEEYEEVQADLKKREDEIQKQNMPTTDIETGVIRTPGRRFLSGLISTVFLQSFTLTFLAEWGDRSQIATIVLAAREDIWGVLIGGSLGHALCTGLAVIGGRMIAQKISVRTVTLIGGVVFILFAFSALLFGPDD